LADSNKQEKAMAEIKTKPTGNDVHKFLSSIEDENKRRDCFTILGLMKEATGAEPKMWGPNIVGFGSYHYKYASGREGDWFLTGFSPRKQALTIYLMQQFDDKDPLLNNLGKFKTGKSCLYIKTLNDIDLPVLKKLITRSAENLAKE
jgi:hypothetical protein